MVNGIECLLSDCVHCWDHEVKTSQARIRVSHLASPIGPNHASAKVLQLLALAVRHVVVEFLPYNTIYIYIYNYII